MAASLIGGILSALGGIAGGVAGAAHGGPPSPLSQKGQGGAPYTPSALNFGPGASRAPQAAEFRLSEIIGRRRPDDPLGGMFG